jgi:hypothetical protein
MTGTTCSLLQWHRSHTSSTTSFTSSRLVLRGVYCMGLAPILPVLLLLLVHDWYYVEFTAWGSLWYFQYYSVYWFTTSTTCNLLKGPRPNIFSSVYWFTTSTTWSLLHGSHSHTSSTTPSTGSRLVLHGVYCKGFVPTLPVLFCLLVHDWYYMQFIARASFPYC